jgi:predicted Rossmann-fold nucleotide-binding protein
VGLLNLGGYYDAMLTFLNGSVREGFMNDGQMGLIRVDTQAIALAEQLVQAAGFAPEGISPQI